MYIFLIDCQEEFNVGYGKYSLKRYYFNKKTNACDVFTYLGNGGTLNNFKTLNTCIVTCEVNRTIESNRY